MKCCFENTLHYSSPGHGDWGVVRIGMLAPQSIQLFVCPSACGRHGAIGAMMHGLKERLHYLYLSQSDIIDGYDDLIPDAVEQVLEESNPYPAVIFIFVSCLDDLIGTDHGALLEKLHVRWPDIEFRACHMNPISLGSKTPPPVSIQNNLYSLLKKRDIKDGDLNSIGNLEVIHPDCELYEFLSLFGVHKLRHISQYQTLESYQEMAGSTANLTLWPAGVQASEDLEKRLNQPFLFLPPTYDLEEIRGYYGKIHDFLREHPFPGREEVPDLEEKMEYLLNEAEEKAKKSIERAKKAVGDLPVIIDGSATIQPFGLAEALLTYGFHVVRVEAQECAKFDRKHLEWLGQNAPDVKMFQPQHHRAVLFDRRMPDSLAIGMEGAYLSGSRHVADLLADLGMFGYDGVCRLMEMMEQAALTETDLKKQINDYGLVV